MPGPKRPLVKKVRRLRSRMRRVETVRRLLRCQLPALGALAVLVLADHLFVIPFDVWRVGQILAGAAFVAGLAWSFRRRPSLIEAAAGADQRMQLRERISSAMFFLDSEKAMDQALIEDAQSRAATLRPAEVFPYPFYRELRWLLALVAAVALIEAFMPHMLLFGPRSAAGQDANAVPIAAEQAKQTARELTEMKQKLEERTALQDPLELKKVEKDLAELQKEFEQQKLDSVTALAKLSKLSDEVKRRKADLAEKAKSLENVRAPENARFTKELAKDLEAGNFENAKKELEQIKSQLQNAKLSEQDKQKLAEELAKLAEQLKDNPQLAEKLKQAAANMKEGSAMKAADNLEMAEGEMGEMAQMLEQMAMLDQLDASLSESKSGMARGKGEGPGEGDEAGFWETTEALSDQWQAGEKRERGSGMGGPGMGMGGQARVAPDQVGFKPDKVKGQTQPGKILTSIQIKGDQTPGQSNVQYQEAYTEYRQMTEDTLEREAMPLEYKNLVSDYFDSIKPEVGAEQKPADSSAAPPEPAAEPEGQ